MDKSGQHGPNSALIPNKCTFISQTVATNDHFFVFWVLLRDINAKPMSLLRWECLSFGCWCCVSCLIERLAFLFSSIIFAIYCMAGTDLTSMNLDSARYVVHLLYLTSVVPYDTPVSPLCYNVHKTFHVEKHVCCVWVVRARLPTLNCIILIPGLFTIKINGKYHVVSFSFSCVACVLNLKPYFDFRKLANIKCKNEYRNVLRMCR